MRKAVFVVLGAVIGIVGLQLLGAAVGFAMRLFESWPGRYGPVAAHSEAADWITLVGIPIGVLVFSLLGFRLGASWDARAGRTSLPNTWRAVFAALGAVAGYTTGVFAALFGLALGLEGTLIPVIGVCGVLGGGAVFSLAGIRLGSRLDARTEGTESHQKCQAIFTAIGAAIGPVIGCFVVYCFVPATTQGDCWRGFGAFFGGVFCGAPTGGILFCLLGFSLGSALDERRRPMDSQNDCHGAGLSGQSAKEGTHPASRRVPLGFSWGLGRLVFWSFLPFSFCFTP